jgi:hypothetical protein
LAIDGTLSGIPGNRGVGPDGFTVRVSDGIASPVSATLNNTNDAPELVANSIIGDDAIENVAYGGTLEDSAFDVDADSVIT